MVPADGDFLNGDAVKAGNEEYLDIEPEAIDGLAREDDFRGATGEQFEAALGVADGEPDGDLHDDIESFSGPFPEGWLMHADELTIQSARADDDVRGALAGSRGERFEFIDGRGEIGIGEETPLSDGLEHAVPDGVAFAAIARIVKDADRGVGLRVGDGGRGGVVGGAVVDDEDFGEVPRVAAEEFRDSIECPGEAQFLIERGNDDGNRAKQRFIISARL